MRIDFPGMPQRLASDPFGNRFGLGHILKGLGDAGDMCPDPNVDGNYIPCPAGSGGAGSGSGGFTNLCPDPTTFDPTTGGCGNSGVPVGGSNTCYAYGSDGSCLSYTTDGGTTIVGCGTNTAGACAPNLALATTGGTGGGTPDANGVTQAMCSNAGRPWVNGTCYLNGPSGPVAPPVTVTPLTGLLNTIANLFKPSVPLSATTAAACAAAGGTWNGVQCVPPGSFSIGGITLTTTTMLMIAVVGVVLLSKKK